MNHCDIVPLQSNPNILHETVYWIKNDIRLVEYLDLQLLKDLSYMTYKGDGTATCKIFTIHSNRLIQDENYSRKKTTREFARICMFQSLAHYAEFESHLHNAAKYVSTECSTRLYFDWLDLASVFTAPKNKKLCYLSKYTFTKIARDELLD